MPFVFQQKVTQKDAEITALIGAKEQIMAKYDELLVFVERMENENRELVASKEQMVKEYKESATKTLNQFEVKKAEITKEHQQEIREIMNRLDLEMNEKEAKFEAEIEQNLKDIEGHHKQRVIMKEEMDDIKKNMKSLNDTVSDLAEKEEALRVNYHSFCVSL